MQIECHLNFSGDCEQAMRFYARCLGADVVDLHRYEGSPMDTAELPPEWKNKVMHSVVQAGSARLMGADMMPGQARQSYSGFSMSVNLPKDKARGQQVFQALAEGGEVTMPFEHMFWGAHFGMLVDRFGVPWMVNCED